MRSSTTTSEDRRSATVVVEFDAEELGPKREEVLARLQRQVRLPGFRTGKVPRSLLVRRLGEEEIAREAVEAVLDERLADLLAESGLDVIGRPLLERIDACDGGGVEASLRVELRPSVEVRDWRGIEVRVPDPRVSDELVDRVVTEILEQRAEVRDVERPIVEGDQVTLNIWSVDAEGNETLVTPDLVARLGRGQIPADVEELLLGRAVGERVERARPADGGADELASDEPGEVPEDAPTAPREVYEVRAVREIVVPDPSDAVVEEVTGLGSLEELREAVRRDLRGSRLRAARDAFEGGLFAAVLERTEPKTVPNALVDPVFQREIQRFGSSLDASGVSLRRYLDMTGQSRDDVARSLTARSAETVLLDLALRAIARDAELEVTDEELDTEAGILVAQGQFASLDETRRPAVRQQLVAEILVRKALKELQRAARILTPEGEELTLDDLELTDEGPQVLGGDVAEVAADEAGASVDAHDEGEAATEEAGGAEGGERP
jgi:trigger factor